MKHDQAVLIKQMKQSLTFLLCYLDCGKKCEQRGLLQTAGREKILSLIACILSVLKGYIPIDRKLRSEVEKLQDIFLKLAFDKQLGWKQKKKILVSTHKQTGGILASLITAAADFLWDKIFSRKKEEQTPIPPPPPPPVEAEPGVQ